MSSDDDWNDFGDEEDQLSGDSGSEDEIDAEVVEWRKDIALMRNHIDSDLIFSDDHEDEADSSRLKEPPDVPQILELAKEGLTPSIHNVLVLNHAVVLTLKNLLRSFKMQLKKNKEEQEELVKYIEYVSKRNSTANKHAFLSIKSCGMPFFKQSYAFPPKNIYTRQMESCRYVLASELIKPAFSWQTSELMELRRFVINISKETELKKLEFRTQKIAGNELEAAKLLKLSAEIRNNESPIIESSTFDWLRVAANFKSQSDFLPEECEAAWVHIIGTHLNISMWSKQEKMQLFSLAEKYCFQNWDTIAAKLETRRSGWQCCIQFQRRFLFETHPWSAAEDEKLKDLVTVHSKGNYIPWQKIYYYFENRTGRQIRERYIYRLQPRRKGKFSIEEDQTILTVADTYDQVLPILKKYFPDRAMPALYRRFRELKKDTNSFASEEDDRLAEAVKKHGENWNLVRKLLPNRQEYELRNRYSRLVEYSQSVLTRLRKRQGNLLVETLPNVRNDFAVSAVMQLLWKPGASAGHASSHKIMGVDADVNASVPMKQLLRILEFGDKNLFGPRMATPRFAEERKAMATRLAYLASVLFVPCDFSYIANRLESLPTFGHPEEVVLSVRELPTPTFPSVCGQCWVPPSALTLMGLRVIFSAKEYLLADSSLRNQESWTWRDPNIPKENRLSANCAKSRLRSRMVHIFYLADCISKITRNVSVTQPKTKKPKPKSSKKSKKHCQMMARARWNKRPCQKNPKTDEEGSNALPKKARMIRVTPAADSTTNVRLIDSSSYDVAEQEARLLEEPVGKKKRGRPRKNP